MKKILLASTCMIALCAMSSPALADGDYTNGIPVTLSADYGHLTVPGFDENTVGVNGSARFDLGWDLLSLQVNGADHYVWAPGTNANQGNVGLGLVWTGPNIRLAAGAEYHMLALGNIWSYGAGGEWFVNDWLTAGMRGGGLHLATGGINGGYIGGQLKGYVCPDFSLSGGADYLDLDGLHETDLNLKAEYQVWGNLGLNAGYTFTDTPGAPGIHVFGVGVTLHLDGDAPLIDHDRKGTADYITDFQPTFFKYVY